jgi:hypothetical protein
MNKQTLQLSDWQFHAPSGVPCGQISGLRRPHGLDDAWMFCYRGRSHKSIGRQNFVAATLAMGCRVMVLTLAR